MFCEPESVNTISLKPVASPSNATLNNVPQSVVIDVFVNEKPSTVVPADCNIQPAPAASPPDTLVAVVPSTVN